MSSGLYRLASPRQLDRKAGDLDNLALQLPPHLLARSIHRKIRLPGPLYVVSQHLVATSPRTTRIAAPDWPWWRFAVVPGRFEAAGRGGIGAMYAAGG